MDNINRILAVSWMTQTCRKTIHYGVSLAEKYQAELFVIHIVNILWFQKWNLPMVSLIEESQKDMERAKKALDEIISYEKKKGMAIKEIIEKGNPVEGVLKTIANEKIDLAVMRAHEESLLEHFIVSGSNDIIIRKMPCSIFLVKAEPHSEKMAGL
jgi:nucleotide-binding universal stress UspA family protein